MCVRNSLVSTANEDEFPFLAINEENKLILFPLMFLHNEATFFGSSFPWSNSHHITSENDCPLEKWIHIGCKVTANFICLYFNGKPSDIMPLSSSYDDLNLDKFKKVILSGSSENDSKFQGYVYNACVLPLPASIKDDFDKNPPLKLSVNGLCASDAIEVGSDGVWNVVGGKLSSKSENRLFSIYFRMSPAECHPFFEVYSPPIRCISRSRCVRPAVIGKRQASLSPIYDRSYIPGFNDRFQEIPENIGNGEIVSRRKHANGTSSKRSKVGSDKSSAQVATGSIGKDAMVFKADLEARSNDLEGTDNCPSDSESVDARKSEFKWVREVVDSTSDRVIFRYCLEGTCERSLLLKEIIKSSSNEELASFAEQVCLYSGCLHHRYPILISKQLIQEETDVWNSICQNGNNRALWLTAALEINKRFMSISCSANRGLSVKDFEVLRGIAGCGEEMSLEDFNRMWEWLYPVAVALSKDQINALWECAWPKWIEGFITAEEAERSLKGGITGMQQPGTFVLRFPTSRSWPHPDAGSLIVTYIGADFIIHHKLLSLDHCKKSGAELLQNLLLKEPELSQLGRVVG